MKRFANKILSSIPDSIFIKLKYFYHQKEMLNLNTPKTFNEKIHWLKLNDRKPEYQIYVDKYLVRDHIEKMVGVHYLIPLINVYSSEKDIVWDDLPDKFILKCTHGSQCNIICTDKSKLNKEEAEIKLHKWLNKNYYFYGREWPYKDIKPRIICETLLEEKEGESITDYKIYCFNGEPTYCQVIRGRGNDETIDFYDHDWNHMPFNGLRNLKMSGKSYSKPRSYDEMFSLSKDLSVGTSFLRVDFYLVNGKLYFGELTLYPVSGFGRFKPDEWNRKIGDMIKLPMKR